MTLFRATLRFLAVGILLAACDAPQAPAADDEVSVSELERRLGQPQGGFTWDDEAPGFGLQDLNEDFDADAFPPELFGFGDEPAESDHRQPGPDPGMDRGGGHPGPGMGHPGDRPPRCPPPCPRGILMGKSREVHRGMGVFHGARLDIDTRIMGFVRGIFGHGRFFGKMIDRRGHTVALLAGGLTRGGGFVGHYRGRREMGAVMGRQVGRDGFLGTWRQLCRPHRGDPRGGPGSDPNRPGAPPRPGDPDRPAPPPGDPRGGGDNGGAEPGKP